MSHSRSQISDLTISLVNQENNYGVRRGIGSWLTGLSLIPSFLR